MIRNLTKAVERLAKSQETDNAALTLSDYATRKLTEAVEDTVIVLAPNGKPVEEELRNALQSDILEQ